MSRPKSTGAVGPSDASRRKERQAWAPELQQRIVRAVVERGVPLQRVARAVGVPRTTAAKWVQQHRQGGLSVLTRRRPGPPARAGRAGHANEPGPAWCYTSARPPWGEDS